VRGGASSAHIEPQLSGAARIIAESHLILPALKRKIVVPINPAAANRSPPLPKLEEHLPTSPAPQNRTGESFPCSITGKPAITVVAGEQASLDAREAARDRQAWQVLDGVVQLPEPPSGSG